jgi:hypothetical protein
MNQSSKEAMGLGLSAAHVIGADTLAATSLPILYDGKMHSWLTLQTHALVRTKSPSVMELWSYKSGWE